jgi:hypothetical protein
MACGAASLFTAADVDRSQAAVKARADTTADAPRNHENLINH